MQRNLKIIYYVEPNTAALARRAADFFVEQALQAVAARGVARIAISGGSTPKAAFATLAEQGEEWRERMPWDKLDLWWVDERCVPPDDAQSNYRMTREALLDHAPLKPEQIHRMEGESSPTMRPPATKPSCARASALPGQKRRSSTWCSSASVRMDTPRLFFRTPMPFA